MAALCFFAWSGCQFFYLCRSWKRISFWYPSQLYPPPPLFFLTRVQTPVTLCSGEWWSILVVRLAHSADLRSRLRHVSSAPSVACSTGCFRVVTHPGTNPARRCLICLCFKKNATCCVYSHSGDIRAKRNTNGTAPASRKCLAFLGFKELAVEKSTGPKARSWKWKCVSGLKCSF